jgi:hypothetical protein
VTAGTRCVVAFCLFRGRVGEMEYFSWILFTFQNTYEGKFPRITKMTKWSSKFQKFTEKLFQSWKMI